MESTVSVSKGVFLFKNGFKRSKQPKKKLKTTLFESFFKSESWYLTFQNNWAFIEKRLKELHDVTYSSLLNDLVSYLKTVTKEADMHGVDGVVPSATLLTGVNQPDHVSQFLALIEKIREDVTPHVAIVPSQDGSTVKNLVENIVWQLINGHKTLETNDEDSNEEILNSKTKIKKNLCTMRLLQKWYQKKYINISSKKRTAMAQKSLVVVIPDFESYNCNILQDFVLIASSYTSSLPIAFVFGVATSVSALHKSFPYHVSSKLSIRVFHSHSSPVYMNQVLEEIFLTHTSPFHLSGKAFELLTDVFLFYDFSVTGLIQSIKYCMMEHYYADNIKSLCCRQEDLEKAVSELSTEDLENIRHLLSFRPFLEVQDCETKIGLFEDDNFFKEVLYSEIKKLHDFMYSFYFSVRLLFSFVKELPKNILGNSARELYTKCAAEHISNTSGFRECMHLINFQSQVRLVESIKNALKIVNTSLQNASPVKPLRSTPSKNNINSISITNETGEIFVKSVRVHLLTFLRQIENANTDATVISNMDVDDDTENTPGSRYKLKEKLLKAARVDKIQSEYEMIRSRFVSYLEEMFAKALLPPHTQTFHEIFFFRDVSSVKKQIVGAPRGALHTALSNPVHYLQCHCCVLPSSESVAESLPDLCLAYKLHRECGKHINLYDWMQAFLTVIRPDEEDEQRQQDPMLQARFTRVVAELQFLGFIKSSKRKTDHVMRLTW